VVKQHFLRILIPAVARDNVACIQFGIKNHMKCASDDAGCELYPLNARKSIVLYTLLDVYIVVVVMCLLVT
jgi:hypothetical protein